MECILRLPHHCQQQHLLLNAPTFLMRSFSSTLTLNSKTLLSSPLKLRPFSTISHNSNTSTKPIPRPNAKPTCNSKEKIQLVKQKWLYSLSIDGLLGNKENNNVEGNKWVIGVDPDASGALAVLKSDFSGIVSAEVYDSPFVQVSIGNKLRKRLDARSIVQLVQSFEAPNGTIAYLEQSVPFPRDGKMGWWSGGFGYGLWIGILVSSGFSVVPVPPVAWKMEFKLARSCSSKDDSRELAKQLFPDLSPMLKRKKDHGRAEALLIAAYGKVHKLKPDDSCMSDLTVELDDTSECAISDTCVNGMSQLREHNLDEI